MHADVRRLDAVLCEGLSFGSVHRRRDPSALLYEPGNTAELVALAHHVDDRIYSAGMGNLHGVEEVSSGVVDRLRRPEFPRVRLVCLTRGGDYTGAAPGGQLKRVGANATGGPHDQDSLTFLGVHR